MVGRREFGLASLATVAAVTSGRSVFAQGKSDDHAGHMEHNEMFQSCAKACSDCQRACDSCVTHCSHLLAEGKKEHAQSLASCLDCADICAAAAQVASRGGPYAELICEACAEACSRCAKECEKFPDDKHMKMCAEECRKCEKACRDMTKHAASAK